MRGQRAAKQKDYESLPVLIRVFSINNSGNEMVISGIISTISGGIPITKIWKPVSVQE